MSTTAVKIYGERNTGTNYLARLVARNLRVRLLRGVVPGRLNRWIRRREGVRDLFFRLTFRHNLGWKHAVAPSPETVRRVRRDADELLFLTLAKNPYSWLVSLHRNPYHAGERAERFEAFVTSPWPTVGRERHPEPFANPVALWNAKNASYVALGEGLACENLRYEDLLRGPEAFVRDVAPRHGIDAVGASAENVERSTKASDKSFADYQRYYLEERWRDDLSGAAVEAINAHLDRDLVERFGYALLDPADFDRGPA